MSIAAELEIHRSYHRPATDTTWMDDAECRDKPTAWWFPSRGEDTFKARRICQRCPVADQCRAYAVEDTNLHGIWGATSMRRRVALRNGRAS